VTLDPRPDASALLAGPDAGDGVAVSALASIADAASEAGALVQRTATLLQGIPLGSAVQRVVQAGASLVLGTARDIVDSEWRAKLVDAEMAYALATRKVSTLKGSVERLERELQLSRGREEALRGELSAVLERGFTEREGISRRADRLVAAAETQRAVAAREGESTRVSLATAQQSLIAQRDELAVARSEATRLSALLDEAGHARVRLDAELATVRTELATARDEAQALRSEALRTTAERERLERDGVTKAAEVESRLRARLTALQTDHAREVARAQLLADELGRERLERERVERREQRAWEELRAVDTRASAEREETVRRAQEMVGNAEAARAAAAAELEELRQALTRERVRLIDADAREPAKPTSPARDAALEEALRLAEGLQADLAATTAELQRTQEQIGAMEREQLAMQHELQLAQRHLVKLSTAHDDLTEDHAQLSTSVEDVRRREADARALAEGLQDKVHQLESERDRLFDVARRYNDLEARYAESTTAARMVEVERTHDRERLSALESDGLQAARALDEARGREQRFVEELAAANRRVTEYEETLAQARAFAEVAERERAAAMVETEALRTAMASAQQVILAAEEEGRSARAEAERFRLAHDAALAADGRLAATQDPTDEHVESSAAPIEPPADGIEPATAPADHGQTVLLVLGDASPWPELNGFVVEVVDAATDGRRIDGLVPGRCLVDLAAPSAIDAAARLAARNPCPLWACALPPDGERGLAIGMLDVLCRPVESEQLRVRCERLAPRDSRVLAVGADSETLIPLRRGLMKTGRSVSIAWDVKQADDLLHIVRPHVVALDLALPPRGTAAFVIALAQAEHRPALLLMTGPPEHAAQFGTFLGPLIGERGDCTRPALLHAAAQQALKK
jgi:hypothetical protein